jgi:hypothetical protein
MSKPDLPGNSLEDILASIRKTMTDDRPRTASPSWIICRRWRRTTGLPRSTAMLSTGRIHCRTDWLMP